MTAKTQPPRYYAYLLRFWETRSQVEGKPSSTWRFSLEDPHSRHRVGFADLASLTDYIQIQIQDEISQEIQ